MERFDAVFSGAGDTLSAALAGLLAAGTDLQVATTEALTYLDHSLDSGFRPGMGHVIADRLFWAPQDEDIAQAHDENNARLLRPKISRCPVTKPNTDLSSS